MDRATLVTILATAVITTTVNKFGDGIAAILKTWWHKKRTAAPNKTALTRKSLFSDIFWAASIFLLITVMAFYKEPITRQDIVQAILFYLVEMLFFAWMLWPR